MRNLYATSALFALTVSAAWAQPPAKTDPPKNPVDATAAAIAAALANDADLKMARAKLQLAEAELAKAKQAVTLRVLTLKAQIESLKVERDASMERVRLSEARVREGVEPKTLLADARIAYEKVNRALATADAEWKLLTTGDGTDAHKVIRAFELSDKVTRVFELTDVVTEGGAATERLLAVQRLLAQARAAKPPVGPVSDRLRAALDKPVKLGKKGDTIQVTEAMDVIKRETALDVSIRGLESFRAALALEGEELPAGAWFQLIQDQFGIVPYVREYGILFADKKDAPADAVALVEFWKQKPAVVAPPAPKK